MFKIMKHRKTLETNADSQTVRAYRECVPNITIEDESEIDTVTCKIEPVFTKQ